MFVTECSRRRGVLLFGIILLLCGQVFAGVTASISGTVKDPSGAAIAGATVTATNTGTGIAQTQTTNGQGYFSFQSLPLGKYTVDIQQKGFKAYRRTELTLDVDAALTVDVTLQVGQTTEKVEVAADALHVETVSSQMGEVIEGKEMTDVPLVSRSFTDLLALQPGVISSPSGMSGGYAGSFISAGFAVPLVSGDLASGALSVNGMREASNAFILNGVLVQEVGYSGAGAIPNLDSLAEFRILTNNTDAEYGNYAGAQINVVTKSGTNQWHGNAFEFLRNTSLDAKNYFDQNGRGAYHQNQFGGTFGGPVFKDKLFFFADYQGNRRLQAVPQVISNAPSAATLGGDFSGIASSITGTVGTVANPEPAWAAQLTQQLGQTVFAGEPYYFAGCTTTAQCVLPNAQLSPTLFNGISSKLLQYILPANNPNGSYSNSSQEINLKDNKFSTRLDGNNAKLGLLTAYYYFDRFDRVDPYWSGNAPLYPGFAIDGTGQTQNINLGMTKTLSSAAVNEFRVGYFRLNTKLNRPLGGTGAGTSLSDLGFDSGASGAPGVYVGTPSVEGIPEIDFNNFVIGVPSRPNQLVDNIYQILDNYTKVIGTHTIKFGGQYHFNQLEENLSNVANGNFFFGSNFSGQNSETGSDIVDFLLGAPSQFVQGQSYPSYGRSFYLGFYGQDSWRVKPNLTLNFGVRYDVSSPWWEKYDEIQTIIPGEQSVVFPGSPEGWLFPGDPHVPKTLAPTRWNNFAPRFGLAYSFGDHDGAMGKLLGKSGASSIRAGYALSYSAFEGATDFNEIGDAPFGDYTGQNEPSFAAPFTCRATCAPGSGSNFFPVALPPKHPSPSNPANQLPPYNTLANFLNAFGTIGSSPAFYNGNRLPYAENYELSFQRQLTGSDLLTLSYVGTQGHRLLSSRSANPGNPALCLATPGCGPTKENNIFINGATAVLDTRAVLPGVELTPAQALLPSGSFVGTLLPDGNYGVVPFGNDSYFITAGQSSYNSMQINYRHTSGRLQLLLGYTYSKSLDNASGYGEQMNPINPAVSRGLSAFDETHNFVVSYNYSLPFDKWTKANRLTTGWSLSGITSFATGLPITLVETDDHSLLGTAFGGPIILPVDTPDQVAPVHIMNPRNPGNYYFSPASFSTSAIGLEGNANRRFFHGPGVNNWNMALHKATPITERINLEFRAEFFNIFNHAQFIAPSGIGLCSGPNAVTSCSTNGSFGQITQAAAPRIGQLSLKLNF
jgi:Carboxypeptidase regulatory-like domain/TonB dependent receptor